MTENQLSPRVIYLDALRVSSMLAVIVIHLAATGFWIAPPGSYAWTVCLVYNGISRFAVPVFVMISGAMYLDPERAVTMTYLLKRIKKLMTVFFFWSFLYALAESLEQHAPFCTAYFVSVIEKTITGHYHMWYIYMIAGLYLATPFLRLIAADRKLLRLFLLAVFLLNCCLRFFHTLPGCGETVAAVVDKADLGIFSGYTGYYCLGYYLHSESFRKKAYRKLAAVLLVLVAVVVGAAIYFESPGSIFDEKMPHVFVYSACIFLLFKSRDGQLAKSGAVQAVLRKIVPCALGVYLIHPVFNLILRKAGLYALTFNPLFAIPLCSAVVCAASYGVIFCMRKFPLSKYFT